MKIKVIRKINQANIEIEIDEKEEKVALSKAVTLSENDYCDACKTSSIIWSQNKGKSEKGEFIYIKRRCLNCGATSTLGEYQPTGSGYFWKKFEIYKKEEEK